MNSYLFGYLTSIPPTSRVDKHVTQVQEWLERDAQAVEEFFAGTIITLFVLMLVANVVRWLV